MWLRPHNSLPFFVRMVKNRKERKDMSTFLGPIHFWLYNKIGKQEELTKLMATTAEAKNWIENASAYTKELPALESVIDESNIHGWLQAAIADAESRYASLISNIADNIDDLKEMAYEFGKANAISSDLELAGIFKAFEDFFVNGMPCDHVNMVTSEEEDSLSWKMNQDIHEQYWNDIDGAYYYLLRKSIMDGMLENTGFMVEMEDIYHYTIKRK
ncbi:hypothetical protein SAMN05216544_0177 [Lachnospira pectinoschiza]|uniref:Uncharacterized protein n=2 Tax=Lachnospira pectinoschiza TaxID=28052 RepID=A0A1G9T382_9FIRM|nr:hypothetical protein SAMN05216544_0177 [Lachnospira pectinoschiza]